MKNGLGAVSLIALLMGLLGVPNPAHGACTALAPNKECASGGGSKTTDC